MSFEYIGGILQPEAAALDALPGYKVGLCPATLCITSDLADVF
jgi:hypothetical protein